MKLKGGNICKAFSMQWVSAFVGPGQSQKCPLNEETFRGKCANEPVSLRILPFCDKS